mmetsp:Transcript_26766/g.52765  ORF Transcript_26766/g.52765 Transcript_26766/m.52765 type:complete len:109 (+) Transcript_26766:976-1302(+)
MTTTTARLELDQDRRQQLDDRGVTKWTKTFEELRQGNLFLPPAQSQLDQPTKLSATGELRARGHPGMPEVQSENVGRVLKVTMGMHHIQECQELSSLTLTKHTTLILT